MARLAAMYIDACSKQHGTSKTRAGQTKKRLAGVDGRQRQVRMPCGVHNCMQQLDKMFVRVCRALKKRRRRRTIGSSSSGCVSSSPSLPMIAQVLLG